MRVKHVGFWVGWIILCTHLPLILATLQFPFGFSDYLNAKGNHVPIGEWHLWGDFFPNVWYNTFLNNWIIRPITAAVTHIIYILGHGDFWGLWLFKWGMKFATATLIYLITRKLKFDRLTALAALIFFVYNPVDFVIYPFNADSYCCLLLSATVFLFLSTDHETSCWSLVEYSFRRFLTLLLLLLLLAGSKEISIVPLFVIVLFFVLKNYRDPKQYARLAIVILPATGLFLRLLAAYNTPCHAPSDGGITLAAWGTRLVDLFFLMIPFDMGTMWFYIFCILLAYACLVVLIKSVKNPFSFQCFLLLNLFGFILLASIPAKYPPFVSARYAIPHIGIISMLFIPECFSFVRGRLRQSLVIGFIILFPCLTIGSLYSQYLGVSQQNDEYLEVIHFAMDKQKEGYHIYVFKSQGEPSVIIQMFFNKYAKLLYGEDLTEPVYNFETDPLREPALVLVRGYNPVDTSTNLVRCSKVYSFQHTKTGGLIPLTTLLNKFATHLANPSKPKYDMGYLEAWHEPLWKMYCIDEDGPVLSETKTIILNQHVRYGALFP